MQIFKAQHTNWQILEGCWTHRSIETSLQPFDMVPLWGKVFKFCDEFTETSLPLAVGDLVGQGGRQPGWILLNANVTQFKLYKDTNFKEESMLGVQRFFEQMKKETTCIGGSGGEPCARANQKKEHFLKTWERSRGFRKRRGRSPLEKAGLRFVAQLRFGFPRRLGELENHEKEKIHETSSTFFFCFPQLLPYCISSFTDKLCEPTTTAVSQSAVGRPSEGCKCWGPKVTWQAGHCFDFWKKVEKEVLRPTCLQTFAESNGALRKLLSWTLLRI